MVKKHTILYQTNKPFEPVCVPGVEFSVILFANDTLIFAANKVSTTTLLWAIAALSSEYGLHLNRTKCVALSKGDDESIKFITGEEVPVEQKAEYLGVSMNVKADPAIEVNRRLANAKYTWTKLRIFWTQGELSFRDKLLIYDAHRKQVDIRLARAAVARGPYENKLYAFFYG